MNNDENKTEVVYTFSPVSPPVAHSIDIIMDAMEEYVETSMGNMLDKINDLIADKNAMQKQIDELREVNADLLTKFLVVFNLQEKQQERIRILGHEVACAFRAPLEIGSMGCEE